MIELYIENQKLDVNESFSTVLTLSIDDIKDFGAKNTTFSKTIILPGTNNNNKLLGNIFNIAAANDYDPNLDNVGFNFNAAVVANAIIFADNMQVFKGIFRVLEIVIDDGFIEYECAVFGELGGFVSALGNSRIENLDFSAYNQLWNASNITNSWNSITGSGIYFPLIDHGSVSTNKVDFQFKAFRPAFYVKEILEKIITASGYTWDFPLLATSLFNSLIIPNNQRVLVRQSTEIFNATFTVGTYNNITYLPITITTAGSFTGANPLQYTGTTPLTLDITCRPIGQINTTTPSPPTSVTFSLKKNGTVLTQQTRFVPVGSFYVNLNLDATNVTLVQNDILSVEISSNVIQSQSFGGQFIINNSVPVDVPINYGENILINNVLPKGVFQKDFFSSIVKMFNLYIFEDYTTDKKIKIAPFITYYEDATAVDWTLKIDRAKPMRIKPMSELSARYYQFAFKQDSDYYNENYRSKYNIGYGDEYYDSESEFVKETEKVDLIFAATPLYQFTGKDKIFPAIYKLSNTRQAEDPMDSVIRIMQAQKITNRVTYLMLNNTTTVSTLNAYGYAGHLLFDPASFSAVYLNPTSDINFGVPKEIIFEVAQYTPNNLFNVYWSAYMAEITDKDSRLLMCTMKLANKDIYQLDFSKLIYIDGVLYRLNKIEEFNASKEDVCKVELIKIINRIY
jgi:hypothetical protein